MKFITWVGVEKVKDMRQEVNIQHLTSQSIVILTQASALK
jgi:hypothetical protein